MVGCTSPGGKMMGVKSVEILQVASKGLASFSVSALLCVA